MSEHRTVDSIYSYTDTYHNQIYKKMFTDTSLRVNVSCLHYKKKDTAAGSCLQMM